jgi:alpha-mannosidase
MLRNVKLLFSILSICLILSGGASAQSAKAPDLSKEPTLYVIPYAHLDTQWNWEYPTTINTHIPNTMRLNFDLGTSAPSFMS